MEFRKNSRSVVGFEVQKLQIIELLAHTQHGLQTNALSPLGQGRNGGRLLWDKRAARPHQVQVYGLTSASRKRKTAPWPGVLVTVTRSAPTWVTCRKTSNCSRAAVVRFPKALEQDRSADVQAALKAQRNVFESRRRSLDGELRIVRESTKGLQTR